MTSNPVAFAVEKEAAIRIAPLGSAYVSAGPDAPASPRAALRLATADIHEALHGHPGFAKLMLGDLNVTEYSARLARLYGFYSPLEKILATDASAFTSVDLKAREKAHLLHADLVSLGLSSAEISALPMCMSFPPMRSQEDVVGCLYVIEGASRGGSVMARKLDHLLGPKRTAGRSFFLGRPQPDPLPWTMLCRLLETCAQRGNLDAIVESARGTFSAFSRWLDQGRKHV